MVKGGRYFLQPSAAQSRSSAGSTNTFSGGGVASRYPAAEDSASPCTLLSSVPRLNCVIRRARLARRAACNRSINNLIHDCRKAVWSAATETDEEHGFCCNTRAPSQQLDVGNPVSPVVEIGATSQSEDAELAFAGFASCSSNENSGPLRPDRMFPVRQPGSNVAARPNCRWRRFGILRLISGRSQVRILPFPLHRSRSLKGVCADDSGGA